MSQTKQRRWTRQLIFKALEDGGFHPVDVVFGNGYFIFEHGKDMVVHFYIKELKGWKFGIWWNTDGEKEFDFFAQYERDIDKFKPAASSLKVEDASPDNWDLRDVVQICRFIKKHPYRAWEISATWCRKIWEWDTLDGTFWAFWKRWWKYSVVMPRFHEFLRKRYLDLITDIANICLEKPKVIDCNSDGWISNPRYRIVCEGAIGEGLEPGRWGLVLEEELSEHMMRRVRRYKRQHARLSKRYRYDFEDVKLRDELTFNVRGKEKQNDVKRTKSKQSKGKKKSPSKVQQKAKTSESAKE